jgi:transposase
MPRRRFTREFKLSAVKLVQEQGYTTGEAAKSLGVDPATIRSWLVKFPATGEVGTAATDGTLRAEVRRLREENKRLLLEREILKKATAFFAKEQP